MHSKIPASGAGSGEKTRSYQDMRFADTPPPKHGAIINVFLDIHGFSPFPNYCFHHSEQRKTLQPEALSPALLSYACPNL